MTVLEVVCYLAIVVLFTLAVAGVTAAAVLGVLPFFVIAACMRRR